MALAPRCVASKFAALLSRAKFHSYIIVVFGSGFVDTRFAGYVSFSKVNNPAWNVEVPFCPELECS